VSAAPAFHEFLQTTPDAVVVIDGSGKIVFANNQVKPFLGYLPEDLVGQPLAVLIPARHHDIHASHHRKYMLEPKARMMGVGLDLVATRKDGSEFKTEISLSPYQSPDGIVVIAAMRDCEALNASKTILEAENTALRALLEQAQLNAEALVAKAGIEASQLKSTQESQALLLDEVHHRMKNMLAMVVGITSQTLLTSKSLDEGRLAILNRLVALGRAQHQLRTFTHRPAVAPTCAARATRSGADYFYATRRLCWVVKVLKCCTACTKARQGPLAGSSSLAS
jgi:PAS domain S-box-containing protein